MYPGTHAKTQPNQPAVIMAETGQSMTFKELDEASSRIANMLRSLGLKQGDHISLLMDNRLEFFQVTWAALRSGLHLTPVNRYLTADEAAYIINDSGAMALFSSDTLTEPMATLTDLCPACKHFFMAGQAADGWQPLQETMAAASAEAPDDEMLGEAMVYSSGTTGKPKGVKRPLSGLPASTGPFITDTLSLLGMGTETRYLTPAPMYHAAPFYYTNGVIAVGGTVVVMEKFDAIESLKAIQTYRITHSQWVPTMFVRMMKLPEQERLRWDLSSHQLVLHAAAPCPVEIKRQMIEWWGPILLEYYAGSEANGVTLIDSNTWLEHPGSVGQALQGVVHICDDEGNDVPVGDTGLVYFEPDGNQVPFEYHGDKEKTREAQNPKHRDWTTLGDVGHVDADGFLYLTDRKSYMIISGGVNIYPQEIEDALILHEKVADVAVFGVPNEDFGEEVKAAVQLAKGIAPSAEVAQELMEYVRSKLAAYKVPRSVDFEAELPRLPTGKLYKRVLRDRYWDKSSGG